MKKQIEENAKITQLFIAFIIFILLFIFYGFWTSNFKVTIQQEKYYSEKVDSTVRILFFSDLHNLDYKILSDNLKEQVEESAPNLIVMGGDMINQDNDRFENILSLLHYLPDDIPIIYTYGNEEVNNPDLDQLVEKLEKVNVIILDLNWVDLLINGQTIRLGGMYDYSFAADGNASPDPIVTNPEVSEFLSNFQNTSSLKVMIHHRPDSFIFSSVPDYWNIDISLAGHDHGGQVILPVVGGLWAPDQGWFPKYIHGEYKFGKLTMFISSGVSTGPEIFPRFNNPREIMIIDIEPKIK